MTLFQGCSLSFLIKISVISALQLLHVLRANFGNNHHKKVMKLLQYKKVLKKPFQKPFYQLALGLQNSYAGI